MIISTRKGIRGWGKTRGAYWEATIASILLGGWAAIFRVARDEGDGTDIIKGCVYGKDGILIPIWLIGISLVKGV